MTGHEMALVHLPEERLFGPAPVLGIGAPSAEGALGDPSGPLLHVRPGRSLPLELASLGEEGYRVCEQLRVGMEAPLHDAGGLSDLDDPPEVHYPYPVAHVPHHVDVV